MTSRTRMVLGAALVAALAVCSPAPASADVASVFDGAIQCRDSGAVRFCEGTTLVETWDGAPIDVNVTLPKGDGPFPLIGIFHGWGGSKVGLSTSDDWALDGYAVFTMSDRGWGRSCGGGQSSQRFDDPRCATGYNHLMDTRYEVRDAQYLMGRLVDEGVADPKRIGAFGGSYGGGMSMALAALRNRTMLPDGSYTAWKSPEKGIPISLAAATPEIPWTDLAYSLVPTGRMLDYVRDNTYGPRAGIAKTSFVSGLFATGLQSSNYAPPRQDPDADLFTWYALTTAGEPYDRNPLLLDALDELTTHHSSYYIDDSVTPAPMLINNGFTDDLFPVDEAIRFYNRTRDRHPSAKIAMYHMDNGHQRGQNKAADKARLLAAQREWMARFVKGDVTVEPFIGVRALTIACGEASEGPWAAKSWRELSPGEIRFRDAAQKVVSSAGDPRVGVGFDPIASGATPAVTGQVPGSQEAVPGGGACAQTPSADAPGTASYRLPAVGAQEYTVLGSPTVIADISAPSPHAQLAARLLDVDPATGKQRLVARGLYRPDASGRQVFQLHPTGWRFKTGHVPKLELLTADVPYGRPANGGGPVTVANLELRLPTAQGPGGVILKPAAKVLPAGAQLACDYTDDKRCRAKSSIERSRKSTAKRRRR